MSNNEMVSVPREPTPEMVEALKAELMVTSRGGILRAGIALKKAIEAAPTVFTGFDPGLPGGDHTVPPAGGEPEVPLVVKRGPVGSDGLPEWVRAQSPDNAPWDIDNIADGTELVDRAHVTRLQAELEKFKAANKEVSDSNVRHRDIGVRFRRERDALQAELDALKAAQGEPVACLTEGIRTLERIEASINERQHRLDALSAAPIAVVPRYWSYKLCGEQMFYPSDPRLEEWGISEARYITDVEPLYARLNPKL